MTHSETIAHIERTLKESLTITHMNIVDDSQHHYGHPGAASGGGHFKLTVVSPDFTGKSALARHRLIYAGLQSLIGAEIHAINIDAKTPEEWAQRPSS